MQRATGGGEVRCHSRFAMDVGHVHRLLRQLELPVGDLAVLPLMLSLVTQQLSTRVQYIVAVLSYAMDVVAGLRKATAGEATGVGLHELLEAILQQLFVLDVVGLVFLHIRLILKRELTGVSPAMEVGCPLAKEGTVRSSTLLRGSEPLEALLNDGRVFTVVVGVHLHV